VHGNSLATFSHCFQLSGFDWIRSVRGKLEIQTLPPTTARLTKSTNDDLFYMDAFHGDRDAHHSRSATSQTNTMQTPAMRTAVPSARVLVP
jgi:hypothetical protein